MQAFGLYILKGCLAVQNICLNYTSLLISAIFCYGKIDNGWLAEGEDRNRLKEWLTNIVTIVKGCYKCGCYNVLVPE